MSHMGILIGGRSQAGVPFISYPEAMRRLRRELAGVAAGKISAVMVARVFGDLPSGGGKAAA